MKSRKLFLTLGPLAALLAVSEVVGYRVSDVSSEDMIAARRAQFDETSELAAARVQAPYELRYPSTFPSGAELEHVIASDGALTADELAMEGPTKASNLAEKATQELIVAVDMYWILPNGGRLHMWQTNDPAAAAHVFLETADHAPEQGPPDISLPNGNWRRLDFYWGFEPRTSLNRLFEDGVFVSVSGEVSFETLRLVAGAVQEHQGI
jgi:hypothetical protein